MPVQVSRQHHLLRNQSKPKTLVNSSRLHGLNLFEDMLCETKQRCVVIRNPRMRLSFTSLAHSEARVIQEANLKLQGPTK